MTEEISGSGSGLTSRYEDLDVEKTSDMYGQKCMS